MERLRNILPGEVLNEEFLIPLNITKYKLAKDIAISQTAVSEIVKGKRGITTRIAVRLSKYFGTTPNFWLNLQSEYEIEEEMLNQKEELDNICCITR